MRRAHRADIQLWIRFGVPPVNRLALCSAPICCNEFVHRVRSLRSTITHHGNGFLSPLTLLSLDNRMHPGLEMTLSTIDKLKTSSSLKTLNAGCLRDLRGKAHVLKDEIKDENMKTNPLGSLVSSFRFHPSVLRASVFSAACQFLEVRNDPGRRETNTASRG